MGGTFCGGLARDSPWSGYQGTLIPMHPRAPAPPKVSARAILKFWLAALRIWKSHQAMAFPSCCWILFGSSFFNSLSCCFHGRNFSDTTEVLDIWLFWMVALASTRVQSDVGLASGLVIHGVGPPGTLPSAQHCSLRCVRDGPFPGLSMDNMQACFCSIFKRLTLWSTAIAQETLDWQSDK